MDDGVADARELARPPAAAREIRIRDLTPEFAECGAFRGIGDDDEVPVLRVGRRRRLLRELEALLEHVPLDRAIEVEPLPDGARRREELVGSQLEAHPP